MTIVNKKVTSVMDVINVEQMFASDMSVISGELTMSQKGLEEALPWPVPWYGMGRSTIILTRIAECSSDIMF